MTTKTIELPAPRELKMTLTEALKARKTIRSFTTEPISDADLSTLLWCTAGITRPDGKRTVPSCLDLRTVSVCVLSRSVFCALTAHGAGMRPRIRSSF